MSTGAGKQPLDIDEVFVRLRGACAELPKAAMFDLRDRGYASPFEQLVASLVSARTLDETTIPVCLRLFARARTPAAITALGEAELAGLLHGATFPEPKARDIVALSRSIAVEDGGRVPDTAEGLMAFRGVGPKIAALTLAVGFGRPAIAVDIHVHRVTNRWGLVATRTPEQTMAALAALLPQRYWIEINERLVPFGKRVCTGLRPRCSTCVLLSMCQRVGVMKGSVASTLVRRFLGRFAERACPVSVFSAPGFRPGRSLCACAGIADTASRWIAPPASVGCSAARPRSRSGSAGARAAARGVDGTCVRVGVAWRHLFRNIVEADRGAPKQVILPARGFQVMRTACSTIRGVEIMRMIRRGHRKVREPGDTGEFRFINEPFGRAACVARPSGWAARDNQDGDRQRLI